MHDRRNVLRGSVAAILGSLLVLSLLLAPVTSRAPASVVLHPKLIAVAKAAPAAPFGDGSPYPGPAPTQIPAAGGVIQAENFNSGPPEQASHACTIGDQGNASHYRPDRHDIDI